MAHPAPSAPAQKERKKPGRVPTSCAECRRLKLRCDRKVPCENCFKRGYSAICPTGSLVTGKGNRMVVSNSTELRSKVESMAARIRELEEALRRATSEEPCPPLSNAASAPAPDAAPAKTGSSPADPCPSSEADSDTFIDAFGTLTIGMRGETSFMSSTARAEYLIGRPLKRTQTWSILVNKSRLPPRVINASIPEHDVTPVDDELRELVMGQRPPLAEAIRLCEIYLDWGKTLWNPLSRDELLDDIVGGIYRADSYEAIPDPHALSLLFSIFALASLFDLTLPAFSIEAYEYYILSRVSFDFSSSFSTTTLHTVFALENHIQWLDLSDVQKEPTRTYISVGLGVKLAYRMGLHLHSARFQLEQGVAQKRSLLFWQMFLMDTMLSFYAGRPPNVSLDWVDAPCPDDEFPVKNDKGEMEMGWHSWSWRFSKLLHEVLVAVFGAKIPTYGTVMEFDKRIRDFPIPSHLQRKCVLDTRGGPQIILQQLLVLTMKESVLLNIHRRYFSQALQDSPADPLKHRYGPSVMAIYRSAWRLIVTHASGVRCMPEIAARIPIFWSQAFSAAIVMCMIVTRAPNSNMAVSSLREVDVLYEVFKNAAPDTRIASVLLELVEKVWQKSHENVHHPRSECIMSRAELDRVGGGSTRLISTDTTASSPSGYDSSGSSPEPQTPSSTCPLSSSTSAAVAAATDFSIPSTTIHPRIMQDIQSFDGFRASYEDVKEVAGLRSRARGGRANDSAIPEEFSNSLIDTQFSRFCDEMDGYGGDDEMGRVGDAVALSAYQDLEQQQQQHRQQQLLQQQQQQLQQQQLRDAESLFYSGAVNGIAMDSGWQSFMEQLGF